MTDETEMVDGIACARNEEARKDTEWIRWAREAKGEDEDEDEDDAPRRSKGGANCERAISWRGKPPKNKRDTRTSSFPLRLCN